MTDLQICVLFLILVTIIALLAVAVDILRQQPSSAEQRGRENLDAWIEREFAGLGVAVRKQTDPPIPGEPFMPMADAKELTRRAVAAFSVARPKL